MNDGICDCDNRCCIDRCVISCCLDELRPDAARRIEDQEAER